MNIPLAERMRPSTIDDIIGQDHLVGEGSMLRNSLKHGSLPSLLLWGPPGTGKTTLAQALANALQVPFFALSAINAGVKDIREVIDKAKHLQKTLVFIDEIHRFNKGQQDALLAAVEKGEIILIGATTENPSFEVNNALLSRCQVYILKPLTDEALQIILQQAIAKDEVLKAKKITIVESDALLAMANSDARKLLNLLELVVYSFEKNVEINITNSLVMQVAQQKIAGYDKLGDQHYTIISAFIKSIRGSDPNAAVYWLARMIEAGEDVKFIARRLLISASEDIGNANPTALVLANACFDAVQKIGYPESSLILSQCTIYLASSPKSNAATTAIGKALTIAKQKGNLAVPLHLRNAPTTFMKNLGYGKNYEYSHNYSNHFSEQEYLPDEIVGTKFYEPGNNTRENEMRKYLKNLWKEKYGF